MRNGPRYRVDQARRAIDRPAEAEALRPDTPELLASPDVAELLGVSRQRIHQLATEHTQFPAPYLRLVSGPIWTRPAIEHFAAQWDRRRGRPTRKAV